MLPTCSGSVSVGSLGDGEEGTLSVPCLGFLASGPLWSILNIGSWEILGKCYNFSVFQFPPCKMGIKRGATWHVTSYYWVGAICGLRLYNHPHWQASPSPIRQVLWLHFSGEKMEACRKASLFVWRPIAVTYPSKSIGTPMPKLVHFLCCKPVCFSACWGIPWALSQRIPL